MSFRRQSSYRMTGSCPSYQIVVLPASFVLSVSRMVDTSRREMGLRPLEILRQLEESGMCFCMIVWHSIYRYRGSAVELLLRVYGRSLDSLRCGQQLELIRYDNSERINEVAEIHGFCRMIVGTCKTTPGICGIRCRALWLKIRHTYFFCKGFRHVESTTCLQRNQSTSIRPLWPMIRFKDNRIHLIGR
jgi:hypothetical protein